MIACVMAFTCYWGQSPAITYASAGITFAAAPVSAAETSAAIKEISLPEKETPAPIPVKVVCSSQELDLTIEVRDAQDQPVTGCSFAFTVAPAEGAALQAATDSRTGQITISPLESGAYTVTMRQTDGYTVADPIAADVAPRLVYEVVDVSEKVVAANEVNAASEDGQFGRAGGAGDAASAPDESIQITPGPEAALSQGAAVETPVEAPASDGSAGNDARPADAGNISADAADATADSIADSAADSITDSAADSAADSSAPGSSASPDPAAPPDTAGTADSAGASGTADTSPAAPAAGTAAPDPIIPDSVYHGWRKTDGATYYYDANGEKVTGLRAIDGIAYHFAPNGALDGTVGIDVSTWQSSVDWQQVKEAGIQFVMIRLGYRGYSSGTLVLDNMYESHIRGAEAAGLKVGVYFFTQAITQQEAVEEASMCVQYVRGHSISYPIAIDMEWVSGDARTNVLNNEQRTQICAAFCQTVRSAGYTPAVYANKYYLNHMISTPLLSSCMIWLAHYTEDTDYAGSYGMWQYTSSGHISGISGRVDLNISYLA